MFPLQRLGAEVWAIHTVQFSNHPGHGAWTGQVFSGDAIRGLVDGIAARGVLGQCDAVLSGYVGDPSVGDAILAAVARVRAANPASLYCCDPVLGDDGPGVYVQPGVAAFLRDLAVPFADILTPNQFELGWLTGRETPTWPALLDAVACLQSAMRPEGRQAVLVTSVRTDETPTDAVDLLAADRSGVWRLRTPLLALKANGAGDAIAALFLFHIASSGVAAQALEAAASSVYGLLRRTVDAGSQELLLVAAQEEFVRPGRRFSAERM